MLNRLGIITRMKKHNCPLCEKNVAATHFACTFAAKGGSAGTGKAKARPSAIMRAAAVKRWNAAKEKGATKPAK